MNSKIYKKRLNPSEQNSKNPDKNIKYIKKIIG